MKQEYVKYALEYRVRIQDRQVYINKVNMI